MPNRLLRDGILDSEAVNALSLGAEVFYRRLMSAVDDFGRFDGRASVLRTRLYPLKVDSVRETDINGWIDECAATGLIELYAVDSKPYLLFKKLGTPRAKESKYPAPPPQPARTKPVPPPAADEKPCEQHPPPAASGSQVRSAENICAHVRADEITCEQPRADAPYSYSGSYSGSGSRPTSGSDAGAPARGGGKSVGRSDEPFDPLRHEAEQHKAFVARWNAAGMRPVSRLTQPLQARINANLLDPWWAEHYPAALEKAGTIPFLRSGTGRQGGPLDMFDFLKEIDLVRQILDGRFDPRAPPTANPNGKPTTAEIIRQTRDKFKPPGG